MIEEKVEEKEITTEQLPEDEMLPEELDLLPLQKDTEEVLNDIVKAKNVDELRAFTSRFNLNMAKKNAVRVAKLQNLLDTVNDQAITRFTKTPSEFSNKEILDYMKAVQDQIDSSSRSLETLEDKPMIQINNQKNEVNITVNPALQTRESKQRVLDAVNSLMKLATAAQEPAEPDSDIIEEIDIDDDEDEESVYNNEEEEN